MLESKSLRITTVKQALANSQKAPATSTMLEWHLLTKYVLGQLTLEQTNELLKAHGRTILAKPSEQLA